MATLRLSRGFGAAGPLLALAAGVVVIGAVLTFVAALLRARSEASVAGAIDRELQHAAEHVLHELRSAGADARVPVALPAVAVDFADDRVTPLPGRVASCATWSTIAPVAENGAGASERQCIAVGLRDEGGVGRVVISRRRDVPASERCPADCDASGDAVTSTTTNITRLVFERVAIGAMRFELQAEAANRGQAVVRSVHQIAQLRESGAMRDGAVGTPP